MRITFQSSPVPKDGRYRLRDAGRRLAWRVSILARPEGRALRGWYGWNSDFTRFQSSPVPKDGRYAVVIAKISG